jgi:hypothetical protein
MKKHGCYNRPPLRKTIQVQIGWEPYHRTRAPILETIPDPMTKECVYSLRTKDDPKCEGCKWKRT